ncbi:phage tail tape measure protein [Tardiphaga sp.]|uniref:phage tail tape measure protein n=1 Tax=Tardiphaga sp. TaxID=1926292 RepID=UPI0025F06CEE|nr:phage tail tape measure protein [Tardiphaga sp.]
MSDSSGGELQATSDRLDMIRLKTLDLTSAATTFSKVMAQAFASSVTGGKQFEDVLKSLALKMSDLALRAAFKPIESALGGGLSSLFGGAASSSASGSVKPFAAGGVIGTPSYFPLLEGGTGLAGEAGPEAIMPLRRGSDGRLGVAGQGGGNTIHVQIATPDVDSFRRSESYITGQIARAVARGQRSL